MAPMGSVARIQEIVSSDSGWLRPWAARDVM